MPEILTYAVVQFGGSTSEYLALHQQVDILAARALHRGDELRRAVAVHIVVPGHELLHPASGGLGGVAGLGGEVRVMSSGTRNCQQFQIW
jgi:hypothetical protein